MRTIIIIQTLPLQKEMKQIIILNKLSTKDEIRFMPRFKHVYILSNLHI